MDILILQVGYRKLPLYSPHMYKYIDPCQIPISENLKNELMIWSDNFNNLVDFENPAIGYISSSPKRKEIIDEGYKLKNQLIKEIYKKNKIIYYPIFSRRSLKLEARYQNTPLKDQEPPYVLKMEQIPITSHLKYEIDQWTNFYEEIIDFENPDNGFLRNSLERKKFIMQGYELQNKLMKELSPHSFVIDYMPIPEVRTLRLMADYDSLPLRDRGYPFSIDLNELPIPKDLISRLENWDDAYVATLNQEYPPDSDFATPEERKKFIEEGYALQHLLQEALKENFIIEYEPLPEKADV